MFLIIFGIILIGISIWTLILTSDAEVEDLVVLITEILGVVFICSFFLSNFMINKIMQEYERGKIKKEYTIIESDTTYKWILKNNYSNLYTKINTLYKRDMSKPRNPMILGEFSEPEFELLKDLKWRGEEKIDGRNSSCAWWPIPRIIQMRGKTENAVIPTHLLTRMQEIFTEEVLQKTFGVETEAGIVYPECVEIFGEGYGFKIQKGGNYIKDHCDFILFDVRVTTNEGVLWLTREACEDIAKKLNIKIVPVVGYFTIEEAENFVKKGFKSLVAENKDYVAEGLVLKAPCGLLNRRGKRLVTKIKYCDYKDL